MKEHPQLKELVEKLDNDIWMGPQGHVVGYFLKQGALYNVVLICPDNLPVLINTLDADLQEMREIFRDWDPKIRSLLELVKDTTKWRLLTGSELATWHHQSGYVLHGRLKASLFTHFKPQKMLLGSSVREHYFTDICFTTLEITDCLHFL